ncbi:MAG: ATP-binding protein [Anaerolineae bacterium]
MQEIDPGDYPVRGDPAQIRQALSNLVENACEAMPEGGTLTFKLSPLRLLPGQPAPLPDMPAGLWWVLSISDTGVGIPPEVLPRVFEPFFSTKGMAETTGLGLTQVYGIVRQHRGHIVMTSQAGWGTTVTLYLPATEEERAEERGS